MFVGTHTDGFICNGYVVYDPNGNTRVGIPSGQPAKFNSEIEERCSVIVSSYNEPSRIVTAGVDIINGAVAGVSLVVPALLAESTPINQHWSSLGEFDSDCTKYDGISDERSASVSVGNLSEVMPRM